MIEEVVLVDEQDNQIGVVPKSEVHGANTPLHRAFSSFIYNARGEVLLQQRSHLKKTWPLVWSNSCCGHPLPGEDRENAVVRRVKDELGIAIAVKDVIFMSNYRYCFTRYGVMENEICPIYVIKYDGEVIINPEEVEAITWMDWDDFVKDTQQNPQSWSEWCVEEVVLLNNSNKFHDWVFWK